MRGLSSSQGPPDKEAPASGQETGAGAAGVERLDDSRADSQQNQTAITSSVDELEPVATYLRRIARRLDCGWKTRSINVATFEGEKGGYSPPLAKVTFVIAGDERGHVEINDPDLAPTPEEQEAIAAAIEAARWPVQMPYLLPEGAHEVRPPFGAPWADEPPENVDYALDKDGRHILMVQVRRDRKDGGKDYLPCTYWDDGQWRWKEPDVLPLFGLEQLRDHAIVFLHEGAKAARAMRDMVAGKGSTRLEDHPWGEHLKLGAHIAWVGGAARPHATDFAPLRRAGIKKLITVCDNDLIGQNAVSFISRATGLPMDALYFDERWPEGADLADPFPDELFKERNGIREYRGPSFSDMLRPATWATYLDRTGTAGRPAYRLRQDFALDWLYIEKTGELVRRDRPATFYAPASFNKALRHVSDVEDTAGLLLRMAAVKVAATGYFPDQRAGIVTIDGERVLNTHKPSKIKSKKNAGWRDYRPIAGFFRHLIPDPTDRLNLARWCATLVACPDIRMEFGVVLTSTTQGVGKTTLADHVLKPLLGEDNVSNPLVQAAVEGGFNSWLANKRLVVFNEIYAGHLGAKAYNKLKTYITDKYVEVNEKFRPQYTIQNWAHFFASSNSSVPLFLDDTDRRWFVPKVAETKLPPAYWTGLHDWLSRDGLPIVKAYFEAFVRKHEPVHPGTAAPDSSAKHSIVEESLSDGWRTIRDLGEYLMELGVGDNAERVILPLAEIQTWFQRQEHLTMADRKMRQPSMLKLLEKAGLTVLNKTKDKGDSRIRLGGSQGRKLVAVANFVPGLDEKMAELVEAHCWTSSRLEGLTHAY